MKGERSFAWGQRVRTNCYMAIVQGYVCMYMYMKLHAWVLTAIWRYYRSTYACVVLTHVRLHICVLRHRRSYIRTYYMCTYVCKYMCVRIHKWVCTNMYKYVCTCACYHICMCTYVRTCRITYMYIFVTIFATILLQTYLDRIKWSDSVARHFMLFLNSFHVFSLNFR